MRKATLLAALGILLSMIGCTSVEDDPSYLRVTLTASPRDLDPRLGGDEVSQRIQQLVFSSLFVLDWARIARSADLHRPPAARRDVS
jgi:hypothetical protein